MCRRASEFDYEVRHRSMSGDSYSINLLRKECSCRKWLLTGLPCCHALSCMIGQGIDVDQYVSDYFRKEKYEACYSHIIYPVNGQSLWTRTEFTDLQPPPIKRQPGRPKKNRRKDADEKRDEQQLKRARYGMKCSRCKAEGHNKSTCKLPPPPEAKPHATQPTASQTPASQPHATQASATQPSATQGSTQPSASQHQVRSNSANAPATTTSRASQKTKQGSANATATATTVSSSQPTTSTLKRKRSPRKKKGSASTQPQNT